MPSGAAQAASESTTFQVTATVVAACAITATNMAFGNYSGSLLDTTSTVSVTCTNGTDFAIGLNEGIGTGGTTHVRVMTGPAGSTLSYGLYQDNGRSSFWGNDGAETVAGTGTGMAQPFTVYGRIAAGQVPKAGSFADTITATVSY